MSRPLKIAVLNFGDERSQIIGLCLRNLGHEVNNLWPAGAVDRTILEMKKSKPDLCLSLNFGLCAEPEQSKRLHEFIIEEKMFHTTWLLEPIEPTHLRNHSIYEAEATARSHLLALVTARSEQTRLKANGFEVIYLPEAADDRPGALNPHPDLVRLFKQDLSAYVSPPALTPKAFIQSSADFVSFFQDTFIYRIKDSLLNHSVSGVLRGLSEILFNSWFSNDSDYSTGFSHLAKVVRQQTQLHESEMNTVLKCLEETYSDYQSTVLVKTLAELGGAIYGGERWKAWLPSSDSAKCQPLSPIQRRSLYAGSKINVSLSPLSAGRKVDSSLFTIASVGGFSIVQKRDEIFELFEPHEVVTYSSPAELREHINYFASHDTERTAIAEAAKKLVLSEHTYTHRLTQLTEAATRHFSIQKKKGVGYQPTPS